MNEDTQVILQAIGNLDQSLTSLKQSFNEFRSEVRNELREIRADIRELQERVDNVTGYRKEIDHLIERVAAIEKRLEARAA